MEKRKIFLSFRPEYFRLILYNIKKIEYRKRFCNEPVTAFLYLSSPVREVVGILELGCPLLIKKEISKYNSNSITYQRLKECLKNKETFAIPIESLKLYKEPISIEKTKEMEPTFSVPQCYLNIEKFYNIFSYLCSSEMYDIEFYNNHETIYDDNLSMSCREMELTEDFFQKDKLYLSEKNIQI